MSDFGSPAAILKAFLGQNQQKLSGAELAVRWAELVGPVLARETRVDRLVEGRLHIAVGDPAWLGEMTLAKTMLLERINRVITGPAIRDLHFHLTPRFEREVAPALQKPRPVAPRIPEPNLTFEPGESPLAVAMARLKATLAEVEKWRAQFPEEDPWAVPPAPPSRTYEDETPLFFPAGGVRSSFLDLDGHL